MDWSRVVAGGVVSLAVLVLLIAAAAPEMKKGELSLDRLAATPVVADGRIKPLDSVARVNLMILSKRSTFKDEKGDTRPAMEWMLDVMTSENIENREDSAAWRAQIFRIENDQVLGMLGLEQRPGNYRYSLKELSKNYEELEQEVQRIEKIDSKQRDLYQQKVFELGRHMQLYLRLAKGREPLLMLSPSSSEEWLSYTDARNEAFSAAVQKAVPPGKKPSDLSEEEFNKFIAAARQETAERFPAAEAWARILSAYRDNNRKNFDKAVNDFRIAQGPLPAGTEFKARVEVFFNQFAPFYWATVLYVFVFLLSVWGWFAYPEVLNRSAFWLAILTFALQFWAIAIRMYLQGRPPVTNLYSSAVFIGWGCVGLGLVLEWIYRDGIGNIIAAVTGGLTVLVAHYLAESSGDTLEMMQAVLDTNFWLATHVTCITLGYSATFFAGFLGILFILLGLLTTRLDRPLFTALSQKIYGVLCLATMLSFIGTVLGGIWADQSWGRFWGWDPKENGALLIVLMNALILHARWGGLVKQRGMAVLAIVGNMVTAWSWFGTNQLGVGLHAYGFNSTLAKGLAIFWGSQLLFIGIGLIPTHYWRSYGQVAPGAKATQANTAPKRQDRKVVSSAKR